MNYAFLASLLLSICMTGCKKEEPIPPAKDTREQAIGTYSCTVKRSSPANVTLSFFNITLKVSKSSSDNSRIDAFDTAKLIFYGNNISDEGSSGFGFDVPKQFEDQDGYVIGNKVQSIGSTMYDGVFSADTKKITMQFKHYDNTNTLLGYTTYSLVKK